MLSNFEVFEGLVTGRSASVFKRDLEIHNTEVSERYRNARCLVIGAAGSIGSALVRGLLTYPIGALALVDVSENNLVEVVRDLRSQRQLTVPNDFVALPIALGSREFKRFLRDTTKFDFIFNLSAMKHVRSEKSLYSLLRMIDTNILFIDQLLSEIPYPIKKVFSVSTDKATNPHNMMGATKKVMEIVHAAHSERHPYSSARFANVAFSDGSLPYGFLKRLEKRQPLSGPSDVRRFFISHREGGDLCFLSAALADNREIFFPKLDSGVAENDFWQIAQRLLRHYGFEPLLLESEEAAIARTAELISKKQWPCYFSPSTTTGEKPFEEFYAESDPLELERFESIGVTRAASGSIDQSSLREFLDYLRRCGEQDSARKEDIVTAFREYLPNFTHVEKQSSLDQKM